MLPESIYLDYNSTTPVLPEVFVSMKPWLSDCFGNPSSQHAHGKAAHNAIELARNHLADLIGAKPSEIVFTSGGTEASNLALRGTYLSNNTHGFFHFFSTYRLYMSPAEHPATLETALAMQASGIRIRWLPLNQEGRIDLSKARSILRKGPGLLTTLVANNESGTIQPIQELSALCKVKNLILHVDGSQAVGKIPCNVDHLHCDLLTIAGHKMGAPQGIGALYIRSGISIVPIHHGGGQERGIRPGTEPVALIVGLGEAARLALNSMALLQPKLASLRDLLWHLLHKELNHSILRISHTTHCLPGTLFISLREADGSEVLKQIPELSASTGSACHDGLHQSRLLRAMGINQEWHRGTIRFSLGLKSSEDEIRWAAKAVSRVYHSIKKTGE